MTSRPDRPAAVVWALGLSVANGAAGVIFSAAWPDLENRSTVLPVSIVVAALLIGAALWLYGRSQWGAVASLILNALNILFAIPGYFGADAAFIVGGTATIILGALTIGLVLSPAARAFWGGASRTAG